MNKLILAFCLTIISSVFAFAQTTDYKKSEFFVGYSNGQVDTGANRENGFEEFFEDRETLHGFNASGVVNVNRYLGIKGDVSGTYRSDDFSFPVTTGPTTNTLSFSTKSSLYNFLGGVQVKDNASTGRLKPFAYALVGAGHGRVKINNVSCPTGVDCTDLVSDSETGLAGAFGGGLDIRVNDKIDFRVVKVDYNPIRFDSGTQHNVRIGVGVVFK
jgi:opacity protein-like surface antigen